jgi:hypothetical protein
LAVAPDVQEGTALGRAQPLVAVAGVVRGAQGSYVEIDHARRVGAVDERVDAALGQAGDDLRDGKDEPGWARHVTDHGQPRPVRGALEDRVGHLARLRDGQRDVGHDHARPRSVRDVADRVDARVVLVVSGQDLVARFEVEAAQDRVDAGRGVGDESQVVGVGVDEFGQRGARVVEMTFELSVHEPDRVALHARAPLGLCLEHGPRTRAERAVVEIGDLWIERPVAQEVAVHCVSIYGCAGG